MEFKEMLEKINDSEDFVKWISAEEEAEIFNNTIRNEARREGLKEGIEQRNSEIASNMLSKNIDLNIISETQL